MKNEKGGKVSAWFIGALFRSEHLFCQPMWATSLFSYGNTLLKGVHTFITSLPMDRSAFALFLICIPRFLCVCVALREGMCPRFYRIRAVIFIWKEKSPVSHYCIPCFVHWELFANLTLCFGSLHFPLSSNISQTHTLHKSLRSLYNNDKNMFIFWGIGSSLLGSFGLLIGFVRWGGKIMR